jgi:hypothetical protein
MSVSSTVLDWTQIAALVAAGAYFVIKAGQGWFVANLSLSGSVERTRKDNQDDRLAVAITVIKGSTGSIWVDETEVIAYRSSDGLILARAALKGTDRLPLTGDRVLMLDARERRPGQRKIDSTSRSPADPEQGQPTSPATAQPDQGQPTSPATAQPDQGQPTSPATAQPDQRQPTSPATAQPDQRQPTSPATAQPDQRQPTSPATAQPDHGRYRLPPGDATVWSCVLDVETDAVCVIEATVLGKQWPALRPGQWRCSLISVPDNASQTEQHKA